LVLGVIKLQYFEMKNLFLMKIIIKLSKNRGQTFYEHLS